MSFKQAALLIRPSLLWVASARVYALWRQNPSPAGTHRLLVDFYAQREAYTSYQLSKLRNIPIVVVHGTSDVAYPVTYATGFVSSLRDAGVSKVDLKIVEDGPHYLSITHPEECVHLHSFTFVI